MATLRGGRSSRYMLVRIDGRARRWVGWADTKAKARKFAAAKALPGYPVAILDNRTGRELERAAVGS